jgi:hypothetical protein
MAAKFASLLIFAKVRELKSRALFSEFVGNWEGAIQEVDRMELQLRKIGYWTEHVFESFYEDGKKIALRGN